MALLAPQVLSTAGLTPTLVAAAGGGDTARPSKYAFLMVKTAGTGTTVTLAVPGNLDWGGAKPDVAVTVASTEEKLIGPLNPEWFADPSTGLVNITYSAVTNVTVGVVTL